MKEKDIVYETPNYWVLRVKAGYEVLESGITHSVRCAQIGFKGEVGLNKAITECNKRQFKYDDDDDNLSIGDMEVYFK